MWEDRILLCGGDVTSVYSGVHRMSVWSIRHCRWRVQMVRFPPLLQPIHGDEDTSFEEPQMSEWSGGSCRSSLNHFHNWCHSFQHDQEGKSTIAVNQFIIAGVRYADTEGQQVHVDRRNCNGCGLPGQMRSDTVQQDP